MSNSVIRVTVKCCTVKIYTRSKDGRNYYQLADYSGGQRKLRSFTDETEAREEAKRIAGLISQGDAQAAQMTGEDRQRYFAILNIFKAIAVDPVAAASEYVAAKKVLGDRSLLDAANYFKARNAAVTVKKTVSEAIDLLITARKCDGRSDAYLRDLETRLNCFAETFKCDLLTISPQDINGFIRSLDCGGRSKNNYRRAITTLFRFAEIERIVPRGHIASADLARASERKAAVQIFSPDELKALLHAAMNPPADKPGINTRYLEDQGILPLLVLGAFAGLRTAEVERQLWTDIYIDSGELVVTAEKGNTAQNRIVPISENLKQWLYVCKRTAETCCAYGRTAEAIGRLSVRAGVAWKHNGLRHSYISYRVAQSQDVPRVALEAGNSPAMIFRHYRKPLPSRFAVEWFGIRPASVSDWASSKPGTDLLQEAA